MGIWQVFNERHKLSSKIRNVVKSKTVEHFAHVEVSATFGLGGSFANLSEHRFIVDIQLNERRIFAVHKPKIAIGAIVWASVGQWY